MRRMHRIVVDAMGGDHAPDEIVQGAAEASLSLASAEIPAPVSTRTRLPLSSWIRIRVLVSYKHQVVKADQC